MTALPACRDCRFYSQRGDTERLCGAPMEAPNQPANVDVFWMRVHGLCGTEGRLFKEREHGETE